MTRRRLSSWGRIWRVITTELRRATADHQAIRQRRSEAGRKGAQTRRAKREAHAERIMGQGIEGEK